MLYLNFRLNKRLIVGGICLVAAALLIAWFFISSHKSALPRGGETSDRMAFIYSLGYRADMTKETAEEISIPPEFSDAYENYNQIQLKAGFDLTPYKGKSAAIYTYPLTNFRSGTGINLIVCEGRIIGGEISSGENDLTLPLVKKESIIGE